MGAENPLHRARLARGIDLTEVSRRTCLSPQVVQKIDDGRFDELPAGVYARSYIRAFATAVDLDPEIAVAELSDRLPPAADPLPVLRDVAGRSTLSRLQPLVLLMTSRVARLASVWNGAQRLRPPRGRLLDRVAGIQPLLPPGRRLAAVCVDAAVLVLLYALLVQVTAWTTGVSTGAVLDSAGAGVAAVWALLVVQYFVLLGGIGGRTPGAWALGLRHMAIPRQTERLGLRAILHRAMMY